MVATALEEEEEEGGMAELAGRHPLVVRTRVSQGTACLHPLAASTLQATHLEEEEEGVRLLVGVRTSQPRQSPMVLTL